MSFMIEQKNLLLNGFAKKKSACSRVDRVVSTGTQCFF